MANVCSLCKKEFIGGACPECTDTGVEVQKVLESEKEKMDKNEAASVPTAFLVDLVSNRKIPITTPRCRVGRDDLNDIVISGDQSISRFHFIITYEGGQYQVQDAKSRHGTFLNGNQIGGPEPINDGDVLKIGVSLFWFVIESQVGTEKEEPQIPPVDMAKAADVSLKVGGQDSAYGSEIDQLSATQEISMPTIEALTQAVLTRQEPDSFDAEPTGEDKSESKDKEEETQKEDSESKKDDSESKKDDSDSEKDDSDSKKEDSDSKEEDSESKKDDSDSKKEDSESKKGDSDSKKEPESKDEDDEVENKKGKKKGESKKEEKTEEESPKSDKSEEEESKEPKEEVSKSDDDEEEQKSSEKDEEKESQSKKEEDDDDEPEKVESSDDGKSEDSKSSKDDDEDDDEDEDEDDDKPVSKNEDQDAEKADSDSSNGDSKLLAEDEIANAVKDLLEPLQSEIEASREMIRDALKKGELKSDENEKAEAEPEAKDDEEEDEDDDEDEDEDEKPESKNDEDDEKPEKSEQPKEEDEPEQDESNEEPEAQTKKDKSPDEKSAEAETLEKIAEIIDDSQAKSDLAEKSEESKRISKELETLASEYDKSTNGVNEDMTTVSQIGPSTVPDWCKRYFSDELKHLNKELDALNDQIKQTQDKIKKIEGQAALTKGLRNTLLAAEGDDLIEGCKRVLGLAGWKVTQSEEDKHEFILEHDDERVAIARVISTKGSAERSHLGQLSISQTRYWCEKGVEPKGVLIVGRQSDKAPKDRGEEANEEVINYANMKNVCIMNTLQVLALYRDIALKDGKSGELRSSIHDSKGWLKGFELEPGDEIADDDDKESNKGKSLSSLLSA